MCCLLLVTRTRYQKCTASGRAVNRNQTTTTNWISTLLISSLEMKCQFLSQATGELSYWLFWHVCQLSAQRETHYNNFNYLTRSLRQDSRVNNEKRSSLRRTASSILSSQLSQLIASFFTVPIVKELIMQISSANKCSLRDFMIPTRLSVAVEIEFSGWEIY